MKDDMKNFTVITEIFSLSESDRGKDDDGHCEHS